MRLRLLTNSERSTMSCPRRWWFRYDQCLTPLTDSPVPLRTGSLWHRLLAEWYRSGCMASWDYVMTLVSDPWMEARVQWYAQLSAEQRDAAESEDFDLIVLMRGMLQGYVHAYRDTDRERWEVIGMEVQVARWLPHPIHGGLLRSRVDGAVRRWAYGGSLDLLVRDRADGRHWFMEHKTTPELNLQSYLRKLHFDPQVRGYAWALREPIPDVAELREPIDVVGVIYNVARKKVPREPEILKSGKGLHRGACDTTREVYLATVLRHGFNPDDYADQLEATRNNAFFAREAYPFTDPELDDFGADAGHAALDAIRLSRAAYHPRQPDTCTGPGRGECPYRSLCQADGPMARRSYQALGIRHAELMGDLAEPLHSNPNRGTITAGG